MLCYQSAGLKSSIYGISNGAGKDSVVVRAPASDQCGMGLNPERNAIYGLGLLLFLVLVPMIFLPLQKPTF